jgi:serine/threonine protein kinase
MVRRLEVNSQSTVGPYRLLERIGKGGMGEVFLAEDPRLDRKVVIKRILPEQAANPQWRHRFERESRTLSALAHPNVVTIHDVGEEDGEPFLVMEHLSGEPLRACIERGPLPSARAQDFARQLAAGLAAAHRQGVVHRDLKPENVMVMPDDRVVLLDFGISQRLEAPPDAGDGATLTLPDRAYGSPGYVAPEMLQGDPGSSAADIYAWGVVVYEMLTGARPFAAANSGEELAATLRDVPAPLAEDVTPVLRFLVERSLAKTPELRLASLADAAMLLEEDIAALAPVAPEPGPRRLTLWPLLTVMALAATAALALTWDPRGPAALPPPEALTYSGYDSLPELSPDGELLAFTSTRSGDSRIWLKQLATDFERPLTDGPDDQPRFDPTGASLYFIRAGAEQPDLMRVSTLGGAPRRLLGNVASVDVAPDGSRLALLRWDTADASEQRTSVLVSAPDASDARAVCEVDHARLDFLRFSADGRRIAAVDTSPRDRVFVADLDAGTCGFLKAFEPGVRVSAADWLDEDTVVYVKGDPRSRTSALLVRHTVEDDALHVARWPWVSLGLSVTPSNGLLFDTQPRRSPLREYALSSTDADSRAQFQRWLARGNSVNRQPVYSPDGSRVAFATNRAGNMDVWQIERDTGAVSRLTDHPASDYDPAFTRDGRLIFTSNRLGHFEIYVAAADGSAPRRVTHDGFGAENGTVTPDGEWVVHVSTHPEKRGIWKSRMDGTDAMLLAPGNFGLPEVSPDGRWVLFSSPISTEQVELSVVATADGAPSGFRILLDATRISEAVIGRARWLPGSDGIAFLGMDEAGRTGVYAQDFRQGEDTRHTRRPLVGFEQGFLTETLGLSSDSTLLTISGWDQDSTILHAEQLPHFDPMDP